MSAPKIITETKDFTDSNAVSAEVTLPYINDNDGTLYRAIDGDVETSMLIRHSTEKAKKGSPVMERHYVAFTTRLAPSELYPAGEEVQAYVIIRAKRNEVISEVSRHIAGAAHAALAYLPGIMNGQGQFDTVP